MTESELVRTAEAAIAQGSKSFAAAARLLDRPTRDSTVLLYAWCRHCDDVIDGQVLGREGPVASGTVLERVASLAAKTRAALDGDPQAEPPFAGLRAVTRRHAIPDRLPIQHLDGFRMDAEERVYATAKDTLDYAYHVAGVVGVMMGHVMGVRDPAVLDRASDLGIAMQLTNIARDLVEDARAGRVYLPANWLAEAGIPAGEVADIRHRRALAPLAARLVDLAEPYYASASIGIRALPPRAAWAITVASQVYREIGIQVKARRERAWDARVSTSRLQKLRHVVTGGARVMAHRLRSETTRERRGLYDRPA